MSEHSRLEPEKPCRLLVDFDNVAGLLEFTETLRLLRLIEEDVKLCCAEPDDFKKVTGGIPRHQTAVLRQGSRTKFLGGTNHE